MKNKPNKHELKCWPVYYKLIHEGKKPFELRLDDRNYTEGDILHLQEYNLAVGEVPGHYTGKNCFRRVTYKLDESPGLMPGYCILGLGPV